MKFPFLFTFIVSAHISIAQVNGPEINSNTNTNTNTNTNNTFNSPSLNELREVEIPTIQEDLEFEQQTIEDNKNKDFKKLEKSRSDDFNSLDDNTDGISLTESNISDLSIRMDELLFDIKFNNTRKTPTSEQNSNMINLLKQYEKINNQSFEFNYFTYIAGNYDVEKVDCLKKAESLKPQNTDVHIQLAAYYFIKDDTDSTAMYLQKLVDVNRIDSTALIYGKDLLSSVTDNGVLFTHGFDDSYACAYLQKVENFRNDVTLLPFDFFQSSFFLDRIKKSNLVLSNSKIIDNEYFKYLMLNNKNKNIHISVSFPIDYVLLFENSFYIKGLTFILENNQNELINGNINFYESISKNLILNANSEKSKELSVNYLPVLFLLKDWYKSAGNDSKVTELDDLIKKIAIQSGNYEKIKQIKD